MTLPSVWSPLTLSRARRNSTLLPVKELRAAVACVYCLKRDICSIFSPRKFPNTCMQYRSSNMPLFTVDVRSFFTGYTVVV